MIPRLRLLKTDTFLRNNAVFFVGTIIYSLLNFLFYPVMGRLLTPNYFGEVQTLFSILSHVTIFFNVLGLVVINIVANQKDRKTANKTIIELEKFALLLSFATFAVFLILVVPLKHFFQFSTSWPLVGLGVTILFSMPSAFRRAVLQGAKDFVALSWSNIIFSVLKLIFAVVLVLLGLKTLGTILAVLIAQIASLAYIIWRLKKMGENYRLRDTKMSLPDMTAIKPELVYSGLTLVISLIFTIQYSIDVLSVKHYFSPSVAGLYAGISTISNIIFFAAGSVNGVLLATIKIGSTANKILLRKSLILTLLVCGGIFTVFTLFPQKIIRLLIGETYVSYAHYLVGISLALLLVSIANLLFIYYLAQRAYAIGIVAISGSVITYLLMLANHASVQAIINNVITGSAVLLVGITVFGFMKEGKLKSD